jgi:hypothetical protein
VFHTRRVDFCKKRYGLNILSYVCCLLPLNAHFASDILTHRNCELRHLSADRYGASIEPFDSSELYYVVSFYVWSSPFCCNMLINLTIMWTVCSGVWEQVIYWRKVASGGRHLLLSSHSVLVPRQSNGIYLVCLKVKKVHFSELTKLYHSTFLVTTQMIILLIMHIHLLGIPFFITIFWRSVHLIA